MNKNLSDPQAINPEASKNQSSEASSEISESLDASENTSLAVRASEDIIRAEKEDTQSNLPPSTRTQFEPVNVSISPANQNPPSDIQKLEIMADLVKGDNLNDSQKDALIVQMEGLFNQDFAEINTNAKLRVMGMRIGFALAITSIFGMIGLSLLPTTPAFVIIALLVICGATIGSTFALAFNESDYIDKFSSATKEMTSSINPLITTEDKKEDE